MSEVLFCCTCVPSNVPRSYISSGKDWCAAVEKICEAENIRYWEADIRLKPFFTELFQCSNTCAVARWTNPDAMLERELIMISSRMEFCAWMGPSREDDSWYIDANTLSPSFKTHLSGRLWRWLNRWPSLRTFRSNGVGWDLPRASLLKSFLEMPSVTV